MDQTPDQQEVLIARDNTSGQVGAVVGQNPDGTPKMADVKSTPLSELIKFNKGQNPLEAFMSNFMRQARNPTLFSFFRLQEDKYELVGPAMADIIKNPGDNAECSVLPFDWPLDASQLLGATYRLVYTSARCPFIVMRRAMGISPSLFGLAFLAMKFSEK